MARDPRSAREQDPGSDEYYAWTDPDKKKKPKPKPKPKPELMPATKTKTKVLTKVLERRKQN